MTEDYTDAVEQGIESRRAGRNLAEKALSNLTVPRDELEALAFWERIGELTDAHVRSALTNAAKTHGWPAIGAVLATSATSAAQRHRRHQARAELS